MVPALKAPSSSKNKNIQSLSFCLSVNFFSRCRRLKYKFFQFGDPSFESLNHVVIAIDNDLIAIGIFLMGFSPIEHFITRTQDDTISRRLFNHALHGLQFNGKFRGHRDCSIGSINRLFTKIVLDKTPRLSHRIEQNRTTPNLLG